MAKRDRSSVGLRVVVGPRFAFLGIRSRRLLELLVAVVFASLIVVFHAAPLPAISYAQSVMFRDTLG
jgi:hypothetical protein